MRIALLLLSGQPERLKFFSLTASVAILVAAPLPVQRPADAFAPKKAKIVGAPSPATCKEDYLGGQPPKTVTPTGAGTGRIFCRSFYSLSYSSSYFNPIWTLHDLTRELTVGGDNTNRLMHRKFGPRAGLTPAQQAITRINEPAFRPRACDAGR